MRPSGSRTSSGVRLGRAPVRVGAWARIRVRVRLRLRVRVRLRVSV